MSGNIILELSFFCLLGCMFGAEVKFYSWVLTLLPTFLCMGCVIIWWAVQCGFVPVWKWKEWDKTGCSNFYWNKVMQSYALKLDPRFISHLFFPLKYSLTSWTDILKLGYLYSCLLWLEKRDWALVVLFAWSLAQQVHRMKISTFQCTPFRQQFQKWLLKEGSC